MQIKKLLTATLLSLAFFNINSAFAEEKSDTKTNDKSIQEKDSTNTNEDDTEKDDKEDKKVKIGARNLNAFSRKAYTSGTAIGGYFDTEFIAPMGGPGNSTFNQHRLITQISSLYNERIFFNSEIEFEYGGTLNKGTKDGELKVEQATLDYKFEDWLTLRGGALLIPVGRLNVLHDSDFRDTTARPLFNRTIVPSTWTETGVGFYGTFYPNDEIEMNYETYLTQGIVDSIEDGRGLAGSAPSLKSDNNSGKALSTRVGISPFIGLDMGLGGYYSTFDEKNQKALGMVVGDFNYTLGAFELLGEGGFNVYNPADKKDATGKVVDTNKGSMWGYYLEAHYNFFPDFLKFSFLGRDFNNPSFTLFSRIDQVDTDTSRLNENDRTQLCFGFNYRPITSVVFKFEYQVNIENEAVIKGDPTKEKPNNQFLASIAAGF
jgi:hypothetical protein